MSLPSGYTRLEYIESTGTQYIDTGFKPNQNTRVLMDVTPLHVVQSKMWCAFGCRANGLYFGLYKASSGNMNLTWFYGSVYSNYFTIDYTKRHVFEVNKNVANVDGATKSYPAQVFQLSQSMFLFCDNAAGKATSLSSSRLYSCKVYDNGTLVRDFIPCKNASGVVGLWDNANNQFYTNAGSGGFTSGPVYIGTHKTLINGTLYDVTGGKCLVGGTAYSIQKGRTLVDGVGRDILFEQDEPDIPTSKTWLMNNSGLTSPGVGTQFKARFVSDDRPFYGITFSSMAGGITINYIDSLAGSSVNVYYYSWTSQAYRTIIFDEKPTGDLLTWLQANATPQ